MNWKRLLAHITGSVDQELLLRNEYLATENRMDRGHDDLTRFPVDGADGTQRDLRGSRFPGRVSISAARSRCEVLRGLRRDPQERGDRSGAVATPEPKPQCPLRTMDPVGQSRGAVKNDPVWRTGVAPLPGAVRGALPRGAEPPGERQCDPVSGTGGPYWRVVWGDPRA